MNTVYDIRHRGMTEGFTIRFDNFEDAAQYAAETAEKARLNGYPVKVDIEIKYIEDEENADE